MINRLLAASLVAAMTLGAGMAGSAFAKNDGGGSGGHGGFVNGMPPGFTHGNKHGWNGGSTPPGWSHGKRKGWNGGATPPGFNH